MKLLLIGDPALRQICEPVKPEELDYIKSLVPDMTKILEEEDGAALAANQVGIIKRFFLMKDGTLVINPEIVEASKPQKFEEGCLSIPGAHSETQRSLRVKVKFKDINFNDVEKDLTGIEAVAMQHEIDHLDGKLYIDQLPPMRRILVTNTSKKFLKLRGNR